MNKFLNGLEDATNFTYTENGALTHKTTKSALLDMFGLGGAYRNRSDIDVIKLFKNAFDEDEVYALKCLFYIRDARGGQGERRFFKVCANWLAENHPEAIKRNLEYIPEFGRWDDLYAFFGTAVEEDALDFIKNQLILDLDCKTPSLLGKWLPSENASSDKTKKYGNLIRNSLELTHKEYRKMLSVLRSRINIVEKLMSENRWDEIEFDKIPSRAGFIYSNAFARKDLIKEKYKEFAKDTTTKVNAKTLYPYECVHEAISFINDGSWFYTKRADREERDTERAMINKYWENLADYINDADFNGIAVVDTSGSMAGTPMEVAISLGLYCAEKNKGPYKNKYITFSRTPELITVDGVDFVDNVETAMDGPWGMNTNIEAVFDLLLEVALANHCAQDEIPQNIIVISDMEFDHCAVSNAPSTDRYRSYASFDRSTLFEVIEQRWNEAGYEMPNLYFWNVDARQNNIPMRNEEGVTFMSGFSPVLYEQIMKGLTAEDLMYDKLDSERYACIK